MKKLLMLPILLLTQLSFADIDNSKFNFDVDIKEDGHFTIVINQKYDDKEPREIMKSFYVNSTFQKSIDSSISSLTVSPNPQNKLNQAGSFKYKLVTKSSRSGVTGTIKNDCTLTVSHTITNDCKVTSARAPIVGTILTNASAKTTCSKHEEGSKCKTVIKGKPSKVKIPFVVKRSSERLAVSGAAHTLRTFFRGHYKIAMGSDNGYQNNRFYSLNIAEIWKDMIDHLEDQQKLDYDLDVRSSSNGVIVKAVQ